MSSLSSRRRTMASLFRTKGPLPAGTSFSLRAACELPPAIVSPHAKQGHMAHYSPLRSALHITALQLTATSATHAEREEAGEGGGWIATRPKPLSVEACLHITSVQELNWVNLLAVPQM